MPQKSKFTQALEDDANKDKAAKATLALAGVGAAGAGLSRANKLTHNFQTSILANSTFATPNPNAGSARLDFGERAIKPGSLMTSIGNPGQPNAQDFANAYKTGITAVTAPRTVRNIVTENGQPKFDDKGRIVTEATDKREEIDYNPQRGRTSKETRDIRIGAQQRVVPVEEDFVVDAKRAADRRTAIRKGMGENMARTGKATPWTQPPKSWNFGGASSRFLKSIGYTGPLGLTTKRSSVTPEQPVAPKSSPKPKTELLANIKRNVARAELAPDVTPASTHLGRAEQFSKFSKQANSRGWKAGVRDAVKIGAKSPVGKGAIGATVLGTVVGGGMGIAKGLAADKVVTDAKKMAGVTSPTNSASNGTKATPGAIDETKANEWDTRLGAVSGRIKYDMAIKRLQDPAAKAFALKYQKDNPHLFKR